MDVYQISGSPAQPAPAKPTRLLADEDYRAYRPVHVVWEITLACDLGCLHCGSRAGLRRPHELSTGECKEVVDSLARLGVREVTLIGGEAYLRRDWTEIVRAVRAHGMYCAIQTGGRNLTDQRIAEAVAAGLQGVGVSIDGLAPLHDRLRSLPGCFDKAINALKRSNEAGLRTSVNTQIGPETMADLPSLMQQIIETGATHWQIQLTVAMGNAVDHDELLLQPFQLLDLMPLLARLYNEGLERGLLMIPGNNIGYFGEFEALFRQFSDERKHWTGCAAGRNVIGLEADGTVKGCPSLPTVGYAGGNVRDLSLEEIWNTSEAIHFGRVRHDDLWGFCKSCYYADVCRGGCTWTSHSLLGRPGNNPYCYFRARELEKQGLRERIVKIREAPNESFAIGAFDVTIESAHPTGCMRNGDGLGGATGAGADLREWRARSAVSGGEESSASDPSSRDSVPPQLILCRACDCYIWPDETVCPHCKCDVQQAAEAYADSFQRRVELIAEVERLIIEAKAKREVH